MNIILFIILFLFLFQKRIIIVIMSIQSFVKYRLITMGNEDTFSSNFELFASELLKILKKSTVNVHSEPSDLRFPWNHVKFAMGTHYQHHFIMLAIFKELITTAWLLIIEVCTNKESALNTVFYDPKVHSQPSVNRLALSR